MIIIPLTARWQYLYTLLVAWALLTPGRGLCEAKIYVIREAGGVIRFTNKAPSGNVRAEVFTARGPGVSTYRGLRNHAGPLFPERYNAIIGHAAREHQLDPGLIKAVIHAESAFNPTARSPKGAQGLMQLMPGTARDLGVKNAWSPASNILGGTRYLAQLLRKFDGNLQYALAAYNAGEENVNKYNGIPPFSETQEYVRRVLQLKRRYSAVSHG
jgi:soluble lytic murein transglycosylase-like protein